MNTPTAPSHAEPGPALEPAQPGANLQDAYAAYFRHGSFASYYIDLFARWDRVGKSSTSWNWGAFLFGGFWLAYRRMYGNAMIYLVSVVILSFVSDVFIPQKVLSTTLLAIPSACLAVLANRLLYAKVRSEIGAPLNTVGIGTYRIAQPTSNSPTSWLAAGLYIVVVLVAFEILLHAEWAFTPAGQFSRGVAYSKGQGVPRDDSMAVTYYRRAAGGGYAPAQNNLGVMYRSGRGVPQDYAQAVVWYRKAAEQGYAMAESNLGAMYEHGLGVPQNDAEAAAWYGRSAAQGFAVAQFSLGEMYANGRGVSKDDAQAVSWYRKAAAQGLAGGQFALGVMYEHGWGTPENDHEAISWYRKAAEQGLAPAQFNLAVMYQTGLGISKDDAQAAVWLRKAAAQGFAPAKRAVLALGR